MSTRYTLVVALLAPVPVGHRIRVDHYEAEAPDGSWEVDLERPQIVDLDTGVTWAHPVDGWPHDPPPPGRRFHQSIWGEVRLTEVLGGVMDGAFGLQTRLEVERIEDPMPTDRPPPPLPG